MKALVLVLLLLVCAAVPAAALLDMGGQKIVVLTAEEFVKVIEGKDAEIAVLRDRLDTRRRVECPLI